jgi:putative intracellular protease/amidase
MARILVLMTKAKTLGLLDGRQHAFGFWAEEFVVPYERFLKEGYRVNVATIGGAVPSPDPNSLTKFAVAATRPVGAPDHDEENIAHYQHTIDTLDALKHPKNVGDITREQLAEYAGVYIAGGHGAMEDMPHDAAMTRVVRWILELDLPLAVVCHGHSALLPLRDSQGAWPLAGRQMTAFSHDEELVTDMTGALPFVLQVELERLGARYSHAEVIWGSHIVVDGNLITGENPYSSAAIAETLVEHCPASSMRWNSQLP